ncbi:uncharacterized protein LOC119728101 [Patiria miniata]|uniref:CABIT domain-containing protein n=1 Tax=Patiria miniata TaxID=46514 RepID=A0A913ZX27_PATMI|nr:uncharacterized protein LOC119728101 [Patiria miniata]
MTTTLASQGCYASAMGSLDWLDTSYSPLQLIEKYKLPTLVRICEGYYGNTTNSCFSAMDVIKMHEIQRVDMVLTKIVEGDGSRYPDPPEPIRICFPKNFSGRFDPVHQAGDKMPKYFKSVRKLAELTPHFVRVKKRPCKKGEGPDKDDILEILGLAMCESWLEDRGFLRCRKPDGEEVMLSMKWAGGFEAIPDPEGYTLQDMLKRFVLPCKVTLRDPQSHLHPESDLLKLLPQLEGTLVLEREITHEFLVGTAVDVGALAQPLGNGAKARSARHQTAAVPWVVLTKNANVLFQICQDMVHKRATYMSLLDMFGDCCMDKIPVELFICEFATPLVAFARTEEPPISTAGPTHVTGMPSKTRSISAPDLSLGADNEVDDCEDNGFCRLHVNPDVKKRMDQRELPPLPPEANPGTGQFRRFGTLPSQIQARNMQQLFEELQRPTAGPFRMASKTENEDNEDREPDCGPYTNPFDLREYVTGRPGGATPSASDCPTNEPVPRMALPIPPHPDPPVEFTSQQSSYAQMDEIKMPVANPESHDAPPTRKPPPPPPRTTPVRPECNTDVVYGNIEPDPPVAFSEPTAPKPTTPESSPPPMPRRAPPVPRTRTIFPDNQRINLSVSHSFSTVHETLRSRNRSPGRLERSHEAPIWCGRPASASAEYLKPLYPTKGMGKKRLTASSKSAESLIEKVDSSDSPSSHDASKPPEASATVQSRPITPCKPTRRITRVNHIPKDISTLTSSELAQCLRLLRLDENIVNRFQLYQINGSLLMLLNSETVRKQLELTDFQAEKVDAFRNGWRPDEEA